MTLIYRNRVRTSWQAYGMLVVFGIMAAGLLVDSIGIDPSTEWLLWSIGLCGVVGVLALVIALLADAQQGSAIDKDALQLVWWQGISPLTEHVIPINQIKMIIIQRGAHHDTLFLRNWQGRIIEIPQGCIPSPYDTWAHTLKGCFEHIHVSVVDEHPHRRVHFHPHTRRLH